MKTVKFNAEDRRRVVEALTEITHAQVVEEEFGRKLIRFDTAIYCIHGGLDFFHGIPEDLMDHLVQSNYQDVYLLFAWKQPHRNPAHYDLYKAPYQPLILYRRCLIRRPQPNGKNDYQFHICDRNNVTDSTRLNHQPRLFVKQYREYRARNVALALPDLVLEHLAEVKM